MSIAPRSLHDRLAPTSTDVDTSTLFATVVRTAYAPVRFVSFWLAVALPFCYLPLLYGGLPMAEAKVFAALLAVNAVCLVLGRNYAGDPATSA
jgi:hypothetical protein